VRWSEGKESSNKEKLFWYLVDKLTNNKNISLALVLWFSSIKVKLNKWGFEMKEYLIIKNRIINSPSENLRGKFMNGEYFENKTKEKWWKMFKKIIKLIIMAVLYQYK